MMREAPKKNAGGGAAPLSSCYGRARPPPPWLRLWLTHAKNNLLPRKKLRSYKYILDLPRGIPASPVAQMVSTLRGMPRISKTKI